MTEPTPFPETPAPSLHEPVATRLVLRGPNGEYITENGRLMGVMLTHLPNADATAPIALEVEQQCDMNHWHQVGRTMLPFYDGALPAEPAP
jgi:hypothetical protein